MAAQDRHKKWIDQQRKLLKFEIGDRVFIKIFPMQGMIIFGKKGKLDPRYIGPFEITEKIRILVYRLSILATNYHYY